MNTITESPEIAELQDMPIQLDAKSVVMVRLKIIGNLMAFLILAVASVLLIKLGTDYAGAVESWFSTASIVVGALCGVAAFGYQPWNTKQ
jgi:hypothetical protein